MARDNEVIYIDTEDEWKDSMSCSELVGETIEEHEHKPDKIQVIELKVKRPHPVLPSNTRISSSFLPFDSHKFVASFLSLESLESFESFSSFFFLFLIIF